MRRIVRKPAATAGSILKVLKVGPLRPSDLVKKLPKVKEPILRQTVWELLESGALAVTPDRKLRPAKQRKSA